MSDQEIHRMKVQDLEDCQKTVPFMDTLNEL